MDFEILHRIRYTDGWSLLLYTLQLPGIVIRLIVMQNKRLISILILHNKFTCQVFPNSRSVSCSDSLHCGKQSAEESCFSYNENRNANINEM